MIVAVVDPVTVVMGGLFVGGGGLVLAYLYHQSRQAQVAVGSVSRVTLDKLEGLETPCAVAVEGRVVCDDPIEPPLTGREAAVLGWSVEEYRSSKPSHWRDVSRGIRTADFALQGRGETVPVEIDTRERVGPLAGMPATRGGDRATKGVHADGLLAEFEEFELVAENANDGDVPDHVRAFREMVGLGPQEDGLDATLSSRHGDRRFSEGVVEPGERAYVLGRAVEVDGEMRVRARPDAMTVVADMPKEEVERRTRTVI